MAISAVPDLVSTMRLLDRQANVKRRLVAARDEVQTGRRADLGAAGSGQARALLDLGATAKRLATRRDALALAAMRAETTQTALGRIGEAAGEAATRLLSALSFEDYGAIDRAVALAAGGLEQVFAALNGRAAGRALFAGAAVDGPAVAPPDALLADISAVIGPETTAGDALAAVDAYFAPGGGFDGSIYLGGAEDAAGVALAHGRVSNYSVRADDAALKQVVKGLAMIAAVDSGGFASSAGERRSFLDAAATGLVEAGTVLVDTRAELGRAEEDIARARAAVSADLAATGVARAEIAEADPYEATVAMQSLETSLSLIYETTARLSRLSLLSFLR